MPTCNLLFRKSNMKHLWKTLIAFCRYSVNELVKGFVINTDFSKELDFYIDIFLFLVYFLPVIPLLVLPHRHTFTWVASFQLIYYISLQKTIQETATSTTIEFIIVGRYNLINPFQPSVPFLHSLKNGALKQNIGLKWNKISHNGFP